MADSSSRGRCELTREQLMKDTYLKERDWRFINPELWDDNVEAPDDKVDAIAATTYIARAIADYTDRPTADEELFSKFCQDFEGWNKAMFRCANATYTKELKRILRFRGVYTGCLNMVPAEALLREERHAMMQPTDKMQPTDAGQPSRAQNQASATAIDQTRSRNQSSQQPEQEQRITSQPMDTVEHNTVEYTPQLDQQQRPLIYNNFDWFCKYILSYPQRPKGTGCLPLIKPSSETNPYKAVPPIDFSNEKLNATTINAFVKMWDRDKKYTGKPYNLLDDKLKIFYSICYHADIRPGQFHAVFPQILNGRAEEYY
ncbi:hypothetical protein EJ02DRAFT_479403 [Clathrospora elynae]|uniref:Uncharacterized protein n=1 Tax=Clathrospora elynae TaxID=706981 RepID=A0A6A5S7P4_9PLEO|nr:hypothetical protein EJ02DRAFT_479403 [Clathrospora elynae]